MSLRIRVASYNIHKCRGLDRRTDPERIAKIIAELDADVVALQEILDVRDGRPEFDQARRITAELGTLSPLLRGEPSALRRTLRQHDSQPVSRAGLPQLRPHLASSRKTRMPSHRPAAPRQHPASSFQRAPGHELRREAASGANAVERRHAKQQAVGRAPELSSGISTNGRVAWPRG